MPEELNTNVEVTGVNSWGEYIREVVHAETESDRLRLYGIESNTETDNGDYVVEVRPELLGALVVDYHKYCTAAEIKVSALVITPA